MYRRNLIALILAFAFLAGCASSAAPSGNSGKSPDGGAETSAAPETATAPIEGEITVHSAAELLEAIQSGAAVCIAPGFYNLSDYLEAMGVGIAQGENWNDTHDYVQIQECYDGFEVFIRNTDGLSIRGGGETAADTQIVVDPRYATVFNFDNCINLKLSNLTLGHTDQGLCAGNVLNFRACHTVELRDMDLYGCGAVGIDCTDGTSGISVHDSVIRDCSYGPLSIYGCTGQFAFYDCALTGSEGGGYYTPFGDSQLSFYRCTFGEQETNIWYFAPNIITEDCAWSEISSYPDYTDDYSGMDYGETPEITFQPDAMAEAPLDHDEISDMFWVGYEKVNTKTGESTSLLEPFNEGLLSMVSMTLGSDATGTLNGYFPEEMPVPFLWEQDSENPAHVTFLTLHHGAFSGTLYQPTEGDAYPSVWMALQVDDTLLWFY